MYLKKKTFKKAYCLAVLSQGQYHLEIHEMFCSKKAAKKRAEDLIVYEVLPVTINYNYESFKD